MSAKGRGSETAEHELYVTPQWCIDLIMEKHSPAGKSVLEPGCDTGPFLKTAKELGCLSTAGFDIRPIDDQPWIDKLVVGDFTDLNSVITSLDMKYDMVYMNPPFSLAHIFVKNSLRVVKDDGIIIMLQRLNWMSGKQRYKDLFVEGNMRALYVLSNRPRFIKGKSGDATDYGFFVFDKNSFPKFEGTWLSRK